MHFFAVLRAGLARRWSRTAGHVFGAGSLAFFLAVAVSGARAAAIHGTVTDASGAKITGAKVALFSKGKVVANAVSTADGSFQLLTGGNGRYYLIVSSPGFRQLETPGFYASRLDSIERNLVLEPEWVRESIVVTATASPHRNRRPVPPPACSVRSISHCATTSWELCGLCPVLLPCRQVSAARRARSSSVAAIPTTTRSSSMASAPRLGRPLRFRFAFHQFHRTCRDLPWDRLRPLWRRCGERRGEFHHPSRNHQFSLVDFRGPR